MAKAILNGNEIFGNVHMGEGGNMHNYSTTEQVVGTWIDGSTVYEKTIYISSLPSTLNQFVMYPHNIQNFNELIDIKGFTDTGTFKIPMPFIAGAFAGNISLSATSTDVGIMVGQDRSSMSGYIIIRYTKTT